MTFKLLTICSVCLTFLLTSCSPKHSEIVLAEYGDYEVTMKEFEDAYAKNVGGYEEAKDDSINRLENFLNLYVNFKMKLRDAKIRGFESNPSLNEELLDYKKKVGVTYLLEKTIVEPGIKDLYEKRKTELRVSHLMIRPGTNGWEDAEEFANAILDSIKMGQSFEEMVKKYSQDKYSQPYGGDIYYITAGMLPAEFENAAYNTPVNQVYPEAVETKFGLHIIKVTDRRDRFPRIRASHILVSYRDPEGNIDTVTAKAKLDTVISLLKEGKSFEEVAAQYSDDPGSKNQGGDLRYFERRQMVKEFDEAAFNLDVNELSEVVRTQYGYHIIKVTEKPEYPSFDSEKETLKKVFQNTLYQQQYDSLVNKLKNKYNYNLNEETFNLITEYSDTIKVGDDNPYVEKFADSVLISYAGKKIAAGEFLKRLETGNEYNNKKIDSLLLSDAVDNISADLVLEEEALRLDETDPRFASLMEDYKNGILIFKLQTDEVWNKLKIDSTSLYNFYEENKEKYAWSDRVNFSEIYSTSDSLIQEYYNLLQRGADFDSLAAAVTENKELKNKAGNHGFVEVNRSDLSRKAYNFEVGEISQPIKNGQGYSIIKVKAKETSRLKSFEEAKPMVSGDFQDYETKRLEEVYINSLDKVYEPVIYYDKLDQAFKAE